MKKLFRSKKIKKVYFVELLLSGSQLEMYQYRQLKISSFMSVVKMNWKKLDVCTYFVNINQIPDSVKLYFLGTTNTLL